MEYTAIAYGLIAIVLISYVVSLRRRWQSTERERAILKAKTSE